MKRLAASLLMCASLALAANAQPAQAPAAASKSQKLELASAQRMRDSLVALRWEARRQALAERDAWQQDFNQVRDSLETIREERAQLDAEVRRLARNEAEALAASVPQVVANPADPLDALRRNLSGRLEALRERVSRSVPVRRDERLAALDSVRREIAEISAVENGLGRAIGVWRLEWQRTRGTDSVVGMLPRPEGDPANGRILSAGDLGAWYVSQDGRIAGVAVRSGLGGAWEWREDLSDSTKAAIAQWNDANGLLPVDPGLSTPDGAGFFAGGPQPGFRERMASFFSFQKGPLHLVALWAARSVMALLVFLGAVVGWIGWRRSRVISTQERDRIGYEDKILPGMSDAKKAAELVATCPDTYLGRIVKRGVESRDLSPEALEQLLTAVESAETRKLEHNLSRLGTIGSNAPFIGLFGTVCGILDAFAALGREGAGPQAVMTAIAEALVATAVGLLVAIPAIWVFNALQSRVQELSGRAKELRTLMVAASLEAAVRGGSKKA
jgi:biopolymer transport protein ExbB/TolQ